MMGIVGLVAMVKVRFDCHPERSDLCSACPTEGRVLRVRLCSDEPDRADPSFVGMTVEHEYDTEL